MKKNILIVGGTSGVGLELAKHYISEGHTVCVTGRKDPGLAECRYVHFSMQDDSTQLIAGIGRVVSEFKHVNTLIYSAGFVQRGHIDTFEDAELQTMLNVGLLAPMLFVKRLKNSLPTPLKVILITSSSQYTARELESSYCAVKSGLGMFGASLVRDMGIGKVLVAAPSGINTAFWDRTDEDTSGMLDAKWVSDQIVELSSGSFKYKYAKILKNPARVEIQECLDGDLVSIHKN